MGILDALHDRTRLRRQVEAGPIEVNRVEGAFCADFHNITLLAQETKQFLGAARRDTDKRTPLTAHDKRGGRHVGELRPGQNRLWIVDRAGGNFDGQRPLRQHPRRGRGLDINPPAARSQTLQVNLALRANFPPFRDLGQRGDPHGRLQGSCSSQYGVQGRRALAPTLGVQLQHE